MEKNLYDQLDNAQAKLTMLRDTAEAVYKNDGGGRLHRPYMVWRHMPGT